MKINLSIPQLS